MPVAEILSGLQHRDADSRHDAGAVRHLVSWMSRAEQKQDIAAIPAQLRARLLRQAQASGDRDKQARAERWLA